MKSHITNLRKMIFKIAIQKFEIKEFMYNLTKFIIFIIHKIIRSTIIQRCKFLTGFEELFKRVNGIKSVRQLC